VIERNLGNVERVFRLLFGLSFGAWALSQPALTALEWFVMLVSLFLILNGVFSRCYLWFVLEIDTRAGNDNSLPQCPRGRGIQT